MSHFLLNDLVNSVLPEILRNQLLHSQVKNDRVLLKTDGRPKNPSYPILFRQVFGQDEILFSLPAEYLEVRRHP